MTEYWKSNPKKFCEVCKCWMADNKIVVQNHELGMRHKSNVDKKMIELQRDNKTAARQEKKLQDSIQQINDSAFVGMMKDLARDPSLAKRYGVVLTDQAQKEVNEKVSQMSSQPKPKEHKEKAPAIKTPTACEWQECTAPDEKKYYWNRTTNATQWDRPSGSVAAEVVSVRTEKDRLQKFVLNRLVELTESGSEPANMAVHEAFNAPLPSVEDKEVIPSPPSRTYVAPKPEARTAFRGPKIDLLGRWEIAEETPEKMPKLDLPYEEEFETPGPSRVDVGHSSWTASDSKLDVLAHLEATTKQNLHDARQLKTTEKQLPSGTASSTSVELASASAKAESESPAQRNVPRLVFRRGPSGASRNLRAPAHDD